jgi:Arc/MetJ-type ribon-helix-helix transcriptional regulator
MEKDPMEGTHFTVTLRKELLAWIDHHVANGRLASRSHAIEYALMQLMDREMKHRPTTPGVSADE